MGVVEVHVRFSSVVLPVVRVDAERLVVLREVEGTPDSLEIKHVEIVIVLQVVD